MKKLLAISFLTFSLTACNLEEINENPNVPTDVPLSTLLPPAQKALADAQGGRLYRYTAIFAQHLRGLDNQELLVEAYQPDEFFVDNPWSDLYVNTLINLDIILLRASGSSPHYAGMARVLMAQALGLLADTWGDVPYFEALNGAEIAHPAYDSQQSIYEVIEQLLDQAIIDLDAAESVFSPALDDLMYQGDRQQWIKAARVLQARYALRQFKRNPSAPAIALSALGMGGFAAPNDDLKYAYLGSGDDTNPIGGFFVNTPNATTDPLYIEYTQGLNDPRYSPYLSRSIPFTGGRRRPGDYYAAPSAALRLVSYIEQEFIRAECLYRTGDGPGAYQVLTDVVNLHMAEVSFGEITTEQASDYINTHVQFNGDAQHDLDVILLQKWIAMITSPECWADWRRTGLPLLTPNPDGVTDANPNGEIPRRLIYPQSERLRNNSFPTPAPHMQNRFWWDED